MINGIDASYFHMDLSSIDPEGYDVSYFNFSASSEHHYGIYLPDIANHLDVSSFIQNNTTDWSLSTIDGSMVTIRVPEPGNNGNGIDMSFEIISKDNYLDRQNYQKKIVNVKKINRQPYWNHMILSVSNSDLLLRDQSWNTTSNPSIQDSGDLSNQFYLYFDSCKNYIYADGGITDLSSYYLDLSALDFEGFDVSYDVSNVKGDLSWAWVDNSRIVIDISDTAESGSDSSLQIISIDDWVNRPSQKERIVKFKHISSQVINLFDISENAESTLRNYNNSVNDYSFSYIRNHITIEPSYQSSYSTYFETYNDFSVNDITSSLDNTGDNVDIEIISSKIDVSTAIFGDISFSFILNNIFKYNFNLSPDVQFSYINNDDTIDLVVNGFYGFPNSPDTIYFARQQNNKYIFIFVNDTTSSVQFKPHTSNNANMDVWFFIAGSGGGGGGQGWNQQRNTQKRYGGSGGGGASGYIVKENITDSEINRFKVENFSYLDNNKPGGSGGRGGYGGDTTNGVGESGDEPSNPSLKWFNANDDEELVSYTLPNNTGPRGGGGGARGISPYSGGGGGTGNGDADGGLVNGVNGGAGGYSQGSAGVGGSNNNLIKNFTIFTDTVKTVLDNLYLGGYKVPSGGNGGLGGYAKSGDSTKGDNGENWQSNMMIVEITLQ